MRKIINLFLVLAVMTTIFSCGDDDTTLDSFDDNPLEGTWKMVQLDYTADATTTIGAESVTAYTVATSENITYEIVFTEDTYSTSGGYDVVLVTTVFGSETTQTSPIANVVGSGEYTQDEFESTITTTGGGFSFDANGSSSMGANTTETADYIIDSNGDLIFEDVSTKTTTQQGATTTQIVDYRMRLTKQ